MQTQRSVDADARDLVRDGRAFEAGKIAFIVSNAASVGDVPRHEEWSAFVKWTRQFPGMLPNALRLDVDWERDDFEVTVVVRRAWHSFRGGWLLASVHAGARV